MSYAAYFVLVVILALIGVLVAWAVSRSRGGESAASPAPGEASAPPGCGACGYDTTGLTSLTCPECGADLRVAGITRGRTRGAARTFAGLLLQFLAAWAFCGAVLWAVVGELLPVRHDFRHEVQLSAPRSGAYAAAVVRARSTALGNGTPDVSVRVDLERAAPPNGPAPAPPPPLVVDPRTGGYEYAGADGARVSRPSGFDSAAVLAWLAEAGVDATDPRVREEAQLIWLAALRGGRMRRYHPDTGGVTGSTTMTGFARPFANTRTTERSMPAPTRWGLTIFACVWLVVFFLGLAYLSRATWRPRTPVAPAPA